MPGILRNRVGYIVYISLWGRTSSITRKLHVDQHLDAPEILLEEDCMFILMLIDTITVDDDVSAALSRVD